MSNVIDMSVWKARRDAVALAEMIAIGPHRPTTVIMHPVDAYRMGWRPTPEEAEGLGWPNGVPPNLEGT